MNNHSGARAGLARYSRRIAARSWNLTATLRTPRGALIRQFAKQVLQGILGDSAGALRVIQISPSRTPDEPLETHRHGRTTIDGWLRSNVPSYPGEGSHPIEIEVGGAPVGADAWVTEGGVVDSSWPGWAARTATHFRW